MIFIKPRTAPGGAVYVIAEKEGFEPSAPFGTPGYKSGAIDHSATSGISISFSRIVKVVMQNSKKKVKKKIIFKKLKIRPKTRSNNYKKN